MKNLFTYLKALWGAWGNLQSKDVRHDRRLTVGSPSGLDAKWKQNPFMRFAVVLTLIFTIGSGNAWGDVTLEFTTGSSDGGQALTDGTRAQWMTSATKDLCTIGTVSNSYYYYSKAAQYGGPRGIKIGKKSDAGYTIFNIASGSQITSTTIVVEASRYASDKSSDLSIAVNGGSLLTAQTLSDADVTIREYTFTFSSVKVTSVKVNASKYMYIKSITIKSAASCSATPTIGTASLSGSFNMTSTTSAIGVASGTCSTGNAACDWTDYGFVWSDGTATTTPTVSNNKVQVGISGTATSWTGSVTPSGSTTPTSWTTGHTYYVRTYGKNSKDGAAFTYGSAWSFTPYLVTFNKNDGGSTTSTQYVQGGVSTPLTSNSFSRMGYNFNGWNTDADGTSGTGYTNGQNVSLSANLTLYAKWTAKQCTVNFDIEGGTGTITSVTATYGQAMPSKESNLPTKTGYNFGGFWDGDDGTGTQYYNADGTSKINWNKDVTAAQTLYAKWTVKSFTVTWMVNGEAYTTGDPSNSVDFGSHVAKLPTAPTPPCGDKFMGWTTTNIGSVGQATDEGLNLFTTAGGAPTISAEGPITYYAVFADYDE